MSANEKKTSKEFEQMMEILKSTTMAGDSPFSQFVDKESDSSGSRIGFNSCAIYTRGSDAQE
jgi:hypothetical protein